MQGRRRCVGQHRTVEGGGDRYVGMHSIHRAASEPSRVGSRARPSAWCNQNRLAAMPAMRGVSREQRIEFLREERVVSTAPLLRYTLVCIVMQTSAEGTRSQRPQEDTMHVCDNRISTSGPRKSETKRFHSPKTKYEPLQGRHSSNILNSLYLLLLISNYLYYPRLLWYTRYEASLYCLS